MILRAPIAHFEPVDTKAETLTFRLEPSLKRALVTVASKEPKLSQVAVGKKTVTLPRSRLGQKIGSADTATKREIERALS